MPIHNAITDDKIKVSSKNVTYPSEGMCIRNYMLYTPTEHIHQFNETYEEYLHRTVQKNWDLLGSPNMTTYNQRKYVLQLKLSKRIMQCLGHNEPEIYYIPMQNYITAQNSLPHEAIFVAPLPYGIRLFWSRKRLKKYQLTNTPHVSTTNEGYINDGYIPNYNLNHFFPKTVHEELKLLSRNLHCACIEFYLIYETAGRKVRKPKSLMYYKHGYDLLNRNIIEKFYTTNERKPIMRGHTGLISKAKPVLYIASIKFTDEMFQWGSNRTTNEMINKTLKAIGSYSNYEKHLKHIKFMRYTFVKNNPTTLIQTVKSLLTKTNHRGLLIKSPTIGYGIMDNTAQYYLTHTGTEVTTLTSIVPNKDYTNVEMLVAKGEKNKKAHIYEMPATLRKQIWDKRFELIGRQIYVAYGLKRKYDYQNTELIRILD